MPKRIGQWHDVEAALRADILSWRLEPGARLSTEADLCARFGVGRHSLRRAVATLVAAGALRVQQGAGTFVADHAVLNYQIGARTRFTHNLLSQGLAPSGDLVSAETLIPPAHVAEALGITPTTQVHAFVAVGRANGDPVNLTCSWHLASLFPSMIDQRRAGETVSQVYTQAGHGDYRRRETTITARSALPVEMRHLNLPDARPVLVTAKVDTTRDGLPIGYSQGIWAADRVRFTVENTTMTGELK